MNLIQLIERKYYCRLTVCYQNPSRSLFAHPTMLIASSILTGRWGELDVINVIQGRHINIPCMQVWHIAELEQIELPALQDLR